MKFASPPSKNIRYTVRHPLFHADKNSQPSLAFIDQFVKPSNTEEGVYLHALSQSIETSPSVIGLNLPVGCSLVCNNHFWLHGRDKFMPNKGLHRELLGQRGVFFENLVSQPYPDSVESF